MFIGLIILIDTALWFVIFLFNHKIPLITLVKIQSFTENISEIAFVIGVVGYVCFATWRYFFIR